MLLVIQIEKLHHQTLKDMEDEKEIIIIGKGLNLCFNDNYYEELEEKARKYDELIALGESISKTMAHINIDENIKIARLLKEKSLKLLKDFDNLLIEARKN